jgi:hypothetical protein
MCESFIVDTTSDLFKISNEKIIAFYKSNPHIHFEDVNILIVDILQKSGSIKSIEPVVFQDDHKTRELESFLSSMREGIRKLIQRITSKYIISKTEYIREFKSASLEADHRELIFKANQKLFENSCSILSIVFQLRFSNIAEKTKIILHQFNKILTANTEQIFAKIDSPIKSEEYIHNFESNSTHMIQAIVQLLSDCMSSYELRVANYVKLRDDPSSTLYYRLIYELNDIVHQLPSTDDITVVSFENLLSQSFPTASVTTVPSSNEFHIMRDDKPAIYIETHDNRQHNIGVTDVKRFIKRAIETNSNGILVSQYTGITSKPNYHIEIHNNVVVVYLHKLLYSSETLQIATDMIDSISGKLTEFSSLSENKYSIPKDILDGVNREYQQFILQKEAIITGFKEQQKSLLSKLDDMRFSVLDKYLSTRYSYCKKQGYNCELCNNFNVNTLKGLAAHKRGCARKLALTVDPVHLDKIPVK